MHHFHGTFGAGGGLLLAVFVIALVLAIAAGKRGDL
jgi:hypothetical protein